MPTCVIFDFDECLSVIQTGPIDARGETGKVIEVIDKVFGGERRFDEINSFLRQMCEAGVLLAVVSRNSHDVVHQALATVQWEGLFESGGIHCREVV